MNTDTLTITVKLDETRTDIYRLVVKQDVVLKQPTRMRTTYNVVDTETPTYLLRLADNVSEIIVDGVPVELSTTYQFETTGLHTVEYTLTDPERIPQLMFAEPVTTLTGVEIPNTVTTIGMGAFYHCTSLTEVIIPNSVTLVERTTFSGCTGLTRVNIPDSITEIVESMFYGCTSLTEITIPNSVTNIGGSAFSGCSGLTNIIIPDGVTNIDSHTFEGCRGLTDIVIPDSVTTIGDSAFGGCSGLTKITLPWNVETVGARAFQGCSSLTEIRSWAAVPPVLGNSAFAGVPTGIPVYVPSTSLEAYQQAAGWSDRAADMVGIGVVATYRGDGDNEVSVVGNDWVEDRPIEQRLPNGLIIDGERVAATETYVFGDEETHEVMFPGIDRIANNLLGDVAAVENVHITGISYIQFMVESERFPYGICGLTNLTSIVVSKGNPNYDDRNGYNCIVETATNTLIFGCKDTVIPDSVTRIDKYAFTTPACPTEIVIPAQIEHIEAEFVSTWYADTINTIVVDPNNTHYDSRNNCNAIIETATNKLIMGCKNTVIPDSVTTIGNYAFNNCKGLTEITIPDSVTTIDDSAFGGCSGLTEIVIPDSVTTIDDSAFGGCTGLTEITIGRGITTMGSQIFGPGWTDDWMTPVYLNVDNLTIGSSGGDENNLTYMFGLAMGDEQPTIKNIRITGDLNRKYCDIYFDRSSLETVTIDDNVTRIPAYLCKDCTNLTSATIGDSVTTIGNYAFNNCKGLTEITIPDSVTTIDYNAFFGCIGLTEIVIPDSVTTIDDSAFGGCSGLTEIVIPDSVTRLGSNDGYGGGVFGGCTGLTSVVIGSGVVSIGSGTFNGCTGLTEVTIPDNVTKICNGAFHNCTGLTDITLGNGLVTIEGGFGNFTYNGAFYGCTGLTSVVIPDSVVSLGEMGDTFYTDTMVFGDCTSLTEVTIGKGLTKIADRAFAGCTSLTTLKFNAVNMERWSWVFYKYTQFSNIVIGDGVERVPNNLCKGQQNITEVVIPDSVKTIGEYAFCNCNSLAKVTVGSGVTEIIYEAFYMANGGVLGEVYMLPPSPPTSDVGNFFKDTHIPKIYVPDNSVDAYKSAQYWSEYADYIFPMSQSNG